MKIVEIIIYILLCMFGFMFLCGAGMFILNFIGLTYDSLTGGNDYFMWFFE